MDLLDGRLLFIYMVLETLLKVAPLGAGPALGCGGPAASSSCTGDIAAHNTASAAAAGLPPPPPAAAADTPSDAPTTLVSLALVSTGSHLVPRRRAAVSGRKKLASAERSVPLEKC